MYVLVVVDGIGAVVAVVAVGFAAVFLRLFARRRLPGVSSRAFAWGAYVWLGFAFLLLFGILIGTYSTIFIASPVAIFYQNWAARRKPAAKAKGPGGDRKSSRGRAAS